MDTDASFGRWLKQRRKALDLTQGDLAQRVGCATTTIRKLEAEKLRPSRQLAERLARALQLTGGEYATCVQLARLRAPLLVPPPKTEHGSEEALTLPIGATPLVGREAELAHLATMLADPTCRLVTLVGPGGIGKTHLALQVAANHCSHFRHGVVWVGLAAVQSPQLFVPTLAAGLNLTFATPNDAQRQLRSYLRAKHLLLVVDNMEHLLTETDLLLDLLHYAPAVKVLITSRERLQVQAEWVVDIAGLRVPLVNEPLEVPAAWPAVELFVQCARRADQNFVATQDEESIACICRLVDGLPLGIELAAAWVRVLTCAEIAHELAQSSSLLTTSRRDVPARHRSLQAVFEHSWNLLTDSEQRVLCQLSIFRGGCTRDAAEQVAGASFPILVALVDKSLVQRTRNGRYELPALVRECAAAKLHTLAEHEAVVYDRHCAYYVDLLQQCGMVVHAGKHAQAGATLSAERDNLRAACQWAATRAKTAELEQARSALAQFRELQKWVAESQAVNQLLADNVPVAVTSDGIQLLSVDVHA